MAEKKVKAKIVEDVKKVDDCDEIIEGTETTENLGKKADNISDKTQAVAEGLAESADKAEEKILDALNMAEVSENETAQKLGDKADEIADKAQDVADDLGKKADKYECKIIKFFKKIFSK